MISLMGMLVLAWTVLTPAVVPQSGATPEPTIKFTADKTTAQIAESIGLRIVVRVPAGWQVALPDTLELPEALSLIATQPVATESGMAAEGVQVIVRRYEVEAYAPGMHSIAPLSVSLHPSDTPSEEITLQTEPLNVRIQSALGFFDSADRLRPIADSLPVPWTLGQWVALVGLLAAVLGFAVFVQRWLSTRLNRSLPGQRGLRQALGQVDRDRLRGKLSHSQTILQSAKLLRQSLQLASGEPSKYRTTVEWISFCRLHYDDVVSSGTQLVLSMADSIRFSGRTATLDDVRDSLAATRQLLAQLERWSLLESGKEGDA